MKQVLFTLLFSASFFFTSLAQNNQPASDCKCSNPFRPACADYCIKNLLQNNTLKEKLFSLIFDIGSDA